MNSKIVVLVYCFIITILIYDSYSTSKKYDELKKKYEEIQNLDKNLFYIGYKSALYRNPKIEKSKDTLILDKSEMIIMFAEYDRYKKDGNKLIVRMK